ncbi:hypothetical protein N7539_008527 [Penicillium diatomitis]|uniref:Uncharacterized protein n=1 Tax=Penicillium diatomitis TaxID=2819901 RepID=A0A9W9WQV0_9EURO|nr:uncharacterized protein N7539_008527 [Penicillium diatomitis]KAJ5471958.1 hypothetical protein N7539_008527 [Penicillium diatomitis]
MATFLVPIRKQIQSAIKTKGYRRPRGASRRRIG